MIDFEATCEEKNYADYPHEIIEFPAVIVDDDEILEGQRLTRYADLVSDQVDENAA